MNIFYKTYFILILTCFSSKILSMSAGAIGGAAMLSRGYSYGNSDETIRKLRELRVKLEFARDIKSLNDIVIQAIDIDSIGIVQEAIAKGANNFEEACKLAEQNGRADIANFIRPILAELVKNVRMHQVQQALIPKGENLPPQVLSLVMAYSDHNEKTWAEDKGLCSIQ